jgi:hypothetical protein
VRDLLLDRVEVGLEVGRVELAEPALGFSLVQSLSIATSNGSLTWPLASSVMSLIPEAQRWRCAPK